MNLQKHTPFYKKPKIVYPAIIIILAVLIILIKIMGLWNSSGKPYLPSQLDPLYEIQGRYPESRIIFFSFPKELGDIQIFMNGLWVSPVFPDGRYYSEGKLRYAHLVRKDVTDGQIQIGTWKTLPFRIDLSKAEWCWYIEVTRDPKTEEIKLKSEEMPDWGAY